MGQVSSTTRLAASSRMAATGNDGEIALANMKGCMSDVRGGADFVFPTAGCTNPECTTQPPVFSHSTLWVEVDREKPTTTLPMKKMPAAPIESTKADRRSLCTMVRARVSNSRFSPSAKNRYGLVAMSCMKLRSI